MLSRPSFGKKALGHVKSDKAGSSGDQQGVAHLVS
jgi:hypothetical protein